MWCLRTCKSFHIVGMLLCLLLASTVVALFIYFSLSLSLSSFFSCVYTYLEKLSREGFGLDDDDKKPTFFLFPSKGDYMTHFSSLHLEMALVWDERYVKREFFFREWTLQSENFTISFLIRHHRKCLLGEIVTW